MNNNGNLYHNISQGKKTLMVVFVLIVSVFFIVLTFSTFVGALNKMEEKKNNPAGNRITVNGTGEVYAKPDLAMMDFSVITEKKTVEDAVSENTQKMNSIIDSMKSLGVEEKDLKTTNFSINPQYEYRDEFIAYYGKNRVLTGYRVSQNLEIKIRDLAKIGEIIEKATSAGANEAGDLYFTVEDRDQLEKQAKALAIEEAKKEAEELAGQLGIKLGRITNFYENSYAPPYYSDSLEKSDIAMGLGAASSIAPDIQTGENKISASVSIIYEIK